MKTANRLSFLVLLAIAMTAQLPTTVRAADRLIGLHSAQVMSQSMPWIAREAGLFKKYDLDFNLVFIPSSPVATAATLSGDAEIGVTGAVGNVRAIVQGNTDLVFIAGMKNFFAFEILRGFDVSLAHDAVGQKVLHAADKDEIIEKKIDVDRKHSFGLDPQNYLGMVHYDAVPLSGYRSDLTARFRIRRIGADRLTLEFLDIHVM